LVAGRNAPPVHSTAAGAPRGETLGEMDQLLKGSAALLVLSLLDQKPMYGYELCREISRRSKEVLAPGEGTLYPLLHALERRGWLEGFWNETPAGRRRRYYRLTAAGSSELARRREAWRRFTTAVERVVRYEPVPEG